MSSGEVKRVSRQDIQLVQNLIERCLQLYMDQKEVMDTLEENAKIEPGFTELVWQKLEEENREFFKAYRVRLMLKNQITVFNQLLQKQAELMQGIHPTSSSSVSLSNGSNTLQQTPSYYAAAPSRPDNMPCAVGPSSILVNGGGPSLQSMPIADDTSLHVGRMDLPTSMLSTHNSHMGILHEMNGTTIKMEPSYSSTSEYTYCTDGSFTEGRPTTVDAPLPTFSSNELNPQPLNEPLLDIDTSSFGFLGQIPRNFSFSDLTEDFTQSTDILESYGRSPFLGTGSNSFSVSVGRECEGENKRLGTISEGVSVEDFGGD